MLTNNTVWYHKSYSNQIKVSNLNQRVCTKSNKWRGSYSNKLFLSYNKSCYKSLSGIDFYTKQSILKEIFR